MIIPINKIKACIKPANDNIDYWPLYNEVMADLKDIQENPIIINHDFSIFPCEVVRLEDYSK